MIETSLFVTLFISLLTEFDVTRSFSQQRVIDAGYFVGRGGDRLLPASAHLDAPVEGAQSTGAVR